VGLYSVYVSFVVIGEVGFWEVLSVRVDLELSVHRCEQALQRQRNVLFIMFTVNQLNRLFKGIYSFVFVLFLVLLAAVDGC